MDRKIFVDDWRRIEFTDYTMAYIEQHRASHALIGNEKETFWVKILQVNEKDETIIGQICNNLVYNTYYSINDYVMFRRHNAINITPIVEPFVRKSFTLGPRI